MSTGKDRSAGDVLLCERCGYVLSGLSEQGACPECGKAIAESLPSRRTLVYDPKRGAGWLTIAKAMVRSPLRAYSTMKVDVARAKGFADRSFHIVGGLTGIAAMALWFDIPRRRFTPSIDEVIISAVASLLAGLVVTIGTFALLWLVTLIERLGSRNIGRWHRWHITREVAYCVCAYASVGWLLGVLALLAWTVLYVIQTFSAAGTGPRVDGAFSLLGAPVSFLIGLFGYELLVYIGLRRCKFANSEGAR